MVEFIKNYGFLFGQLVKRDFNKKYKRSMLGVVWSLLGPLMNFAVMSIIFTNFFGRTTHRYSVFLFSGLVVFTYFSSATSSGMKSLLSGSSIYSRVNVPKYLFVLTSNTLALINFSFTFIVLLIIVFRDGLFTFKLIYLIYPITCLTIFNIGVSFFLGTLNVFFNDIEHVYSVVTQTLRYASAIMYSIDTYAPEIQMLFYFNPIYIYILYFREIIIEHTVPGFYIHVLCIVYALIPLFLGITVYKKLNNRFMYYL